MEPAYGYPYRAGDGREDPGSSAVVYRVVRGGAWFNGRVSVRSDYRGRDHAYDRTSQHGLRIVVEGA
jgi:formylglycine-generating enzyme required for sulfatase activity